MSTDKDLKQQCVKILFNLLVGRRAEDKCYNKFKGDSKDQT